MLKIIPYSPHQPWVRQRMFLDLDCREAFYGGAAAGGKSEALLMAALQYVKVPGYSAIILRKDTQRLRLSGGLIPRSHEWLAGTDAKWNGRDNRWTFPTTGAPATLSFGYLQRFADRYRYGSSEYQFIGFDELTEFDEEEYTFLFSRLRQRDEIGVPLRVRSASNPGNRGHAWVLKRFISRGQQRQGLGANEDAAYLPARIRDNPALNEQEYCESLVHLPPIERERLMNGDWTVREDGQIRADWLQRFVVNDRRLDLIDRAGVVFASADERDCWRFMTVDPACTSEAEAKAKGRQPSWSVAQVWDRPGGNLASYLLLRHVERQRVDFGGFLELIRRMHLQWRPTRIYIEKEKLSKATLSIFDADVELVEISPEGRHKLSRAAPLLLKLQRGEVRLPRESSDWLDKLEAEWLGWTGAPHEASDQIDAAAYAAIIVQEDSPRPIRWRPAA
jgi:hypothetical protein